MKPNPTHNSIPTSHHQFSQSTKPNPSQTLTLEIGNFRDSICLANKSPCRTSAFRISFPTKSQVKLDKELRSRCDARHPPIDHFPLRQLLYLPKHDYVTIDAEDKRKSGAVVDLTLDESEFQSQPLTHQRQAEAEVEGRCHPKIMKALQEQAEKLTLSSRAFYNDKFPVFAEGVETALKLARKWGYEKKKIPKDEAIIVSGCGCFHGRTLAAISMSCDNEATHGFGPLLPGHLKVDFGDEIALEKIFKDSGEQIAGFLFEPIQGEAGVIISPNGYLKAVRDLCLKYNILMIADEIQSGLARSGRMLTCDWEEVHPDMVILGKALGGGGTYGELLLLSFKVHIYDPGGGTYGELLLLSFKAYTHKDCSSGGLDDDVRGLAGGGIAVFLGVIRALVLHLEDKVNFKG